ncbi:MAG: beta-glucosidase BglX [Oliverpabstia sp.]
MEQKELDKLLADMSLEEKIGQMIQPDGVFYARESETAVTGPLAGLGYTKRDLELAGSVLGIYGAERISELQKENLEKQPHHIPRLFMLDVIHGMKTIFPMPLAQGASFDPEMVYQCARMAAKEAAVSGIHVTFAPMSDLVRDARWGRVMESTGEDPYLNSLLTEAMVKGFQGNDLSEEFSVSACVKHFAAYGAAVAGRDYNAVELDDHTLREFYFPAYQAGIQAGAGMVMTSFNTLNGIPASINKKLMRDVLRKEMGFNGVLISDYSAIWETLAHGASEDAQEAAQKALEAGVDIDMVSPAYHSSMENLVKSGKVKEEWINEAVMRILQLKNKLGLFENPYKDADVLKEKQILLSREHRNLAREAAEKSFVLLKNENILPISGKQKVVFIGPYVNNPEIISSWAITGDSRNCITIEQAGKEIEEAKQWKFYQGCPMFGNDYELVGFREKTPDKMSEDEQKRLEEEAVSAAENAEVAVLCLGEHYLQTGEATSRGMLEIPDVQMKLLRRVAEVNKNLVVVLFNGRPLDLREISGMAKAILEVWLPGTEGGHAIMNVLTGKTNPSGKLPVSFPYCVGQVPVYYNSYSTGRPNSPKLRERYRSKYLDIPNEPLYPFGFGMSYTEFSIGSIKVNRCIVTKEEPVIAEVTVKNIGERKGVQTVQLYIQDEAASVVRPVKELKGIQKVELEPGECRQVQFTIHEKMLQFFGTDGCLRCEPGTFRIFIGDSSTVEENVQICYCDS